MAQSTDTASGVPSIFPMMLVSLFAYAKCNPLLGVLQSNHGPAGKRTCWSAIIHFRNVAFIASMRKQGIVPLDPPPGVNLVWNSPRNGMRGQVFTKKQTDHEGRFDVIYFFTFDLELKW